MAKSGGKSHPFQKGPPNPLEKSILPRKNVQIRWKKAFFPESMAKSGGKSHPFQKGRPNPLEKSILRRKNVQIRWKKPGFSPKSRKQQDRSGFAQKSFKPLSP
jgi:hypothetical protein